MISPYFSDDDLICSLRKYYNKSEQYRINFYSYLNSSIKTNNGILIKIGHREFLIDYFTGSVIKEV